MVAGARGGKTERMSDGSGGCVVKRVEAGGNRVRPGLKDGTEPAETPFWTRCGDASPPLATEEPIRALGVSLVAIAAIVASLTVVRQQRQEERRAGDNVGPEPSPAAVDLDLDGIRAAGF